jgi:hypothetical protein
MNGRIDITLTGVSDAEEVSVVARWDESEFPVEPVEQPFPGEPVEVLSCSEEAEEIFGEADLDQDGVIDERELKTFDIGAEELKEIDINGDGTVEFREALQLSCTCDNELSTVFDEHAQGRENVPIAVLLEHEWANTHDFASVDANRDGQLSEEELDLLLELCETTYDAFDGDGDGVPDEVDAFPEDPSESKDTDGDGVGDNADIVASVSNDIIYASAGLLFLVLAGLLLGFLRTNRPRGGGTETWGDEDRMSEAMFGVDASSDYTKEPVDIPSTVETPSMTTTEPVSIPSLGQPLGSEVMSDLLGSTNDVQRPPAELMGMVLDGIETVEYPTGSGTVWTRPSPDTDWRQKI